MDAFKHSDDPPEPPDDLAFADHQDGSLDLAALQELLLRTQTLRDFLDELVVAAARSTAHHCGITVRGTNGGEDYTAASSNELVRRLDEAQYSEGQGPCLQSLETGLPVITTDLRTETRWGPYPAQALQLGAFSSLSYPLIAREVSIGALNLYSTEPVVPGVELQTQAAGLAGQMGGALALALRLAERDELISTLRVALRSRSGIDQAIGILMAQQRCDAPTAFDLLRSASQSRNVKLRDVAAQIVEGLSPNQSGSRPGRS